MPATPVERPADRAVALPDSTARRHHHRSPVRLHECEDTPWLEHTPDLRQRSLRVWEMLQGAVGARTIKFAIGDSHMLRVALKYQDVAKVRRLIGLLCRQRPRLAHQRRIDL